MQSLSAVVGMLASLGHNFEVKTSTSDGTRFHDDTGKLAYVTCYDTPLGFERKAVADALEGGTLHTKGKRPYWEWCCKVVESRP